MSTRRTLRVADLLLREVASILQKEVKDPRIGIVTLTNADVSPDLRVAKVYYTVLGDEAARAACQEGLTRASGYIRREIAKRLTLRTTPELRFYYDEALDRGLRINALIDAVSPHPPKPSEENDDDDDGLSNGD